MKLRWRQRRAASVHFVQEKEESLRQGPSQVFVMLQVPEQEKFERPPYASAFVEKAANVQTLDLPTTFFLDPSLLRRGQLDLLHTAPPVPEHILQLFDDSSEIHHTAVKFFDHIHQWMPFVSRKRFYETHLQQSNRDRPETVLLLLAVKVITTVPPTSPRNPRTGLYLTTKDFHLQVESSNAFSLPILQAGVLLALYEIGHGIYPSAFLTIGACARYGHALGINTGAALDARRPLTLVEIEERRRVWWAIVILDRFVNIGCPDRPLACADPNLDDVLPADDAAWDQGDVRASKVFTMSSPTNAHMSKFALLCQAARLLGHVLQYVSRTGAVHEEIGVQLDRTLQSMLSATLEVESPDNDQIAFVYSALVALHVPWLPSKFASPAVMEQSQGASAVMQQITEKVTANLVKGQCFSDKDPEDTAPWGLFFAYHLFRHIRHSGQIFHHSVNVLNSLKDAFRVVDARWNVAGVYLQLLEAHEALGEV